MPKKLRKGITGRGRLVIVKDENKQETERYYRINLSNGMSFKSHEPRPEGVTGALVEVYEKGEKASWDDTVVLENGAVIFKDWESISSLRSAQDHDKEVLAFEDDTIEEEIPESAKKIAD